MFAFPVDWAHRVPVVGAFADAFAEVDDVLVVFVVIVRAEALDADHARGMGTGLQRLPAGGASAGSGMDVDVGSGASDAHDSTTASSGTQRVSIQPICASTNAQ